VCLASRVEQRELRRLNFIEQSGPIGRMRTRTKGTDLRGGLIGGQANFLAISFPDWQPEQIVMVGAGGFGRKSEPLAVRIKLLRHDK
jgi:hypothetical protein